MSDSTENAEPLPHPFEESDVATVSLVEYVRWFIDSNHKRHHLVQLPPIQRSEVWKVAQVERLWDSLLRGFPIGSFLLAPRNMKAAARSTESREQRPSEGDGWFLLDGQQRTRALLLGFRPSPSARLWIDLAPPRVFDNADHNDRMFLFRLLTSAQPWGMEWNDPDAKLGESTKYEPRKAILRDEKHYDYEVKLDLGPCADPGWQPDATKAWPLRAELPVPFDALLPCVVGLLGLL